MSDYRVCLITFPELEKAREFARALVERRLVACVNIVPRIESFYWWKGEIQQDGEVLLVLKTVVDRLEEFVATAQELHPYEVPEVLCLEVERGNQSYLDWLTDSTRPAV
ncbi:MAG: divalent-cation tolerance protein CutA [Vulcanimicrobiota bacterium]